MQLGLSSISNWVGIIGIIIVAVVGVLCFGWVQILNTTNKLLKEQNKALVDQNTELKADNKEWQAKHVENQKDIAKLQGQIDTLTKIPLHDISKSLKALEDSNSQIVSILQERAAAEAVVASRVADVKANLAK